jgi:hypothetical protein
MNAGFLSGKHCLLFGQINCKNSNYYIINYNQNQTITAAKFNKNNAQDYTS